MKNILVFLILGSLASCTNLNKQDNHLTLEEECKQAGDLSKQCEIVNIKGLTLDEKENLLGWIYLNGSEKIVPNYDKAYYWLEKAAKSQNNEALNSLGTIYFLGLGKNKDLKKAEEYYLKADQLGNKEAKLNLAELYWSNGQDTLPDYEKSEKWYLAGMKDNQLRAYEGLSKMYIDQGKFKDAFDYSRKAAELGSSEAEYNLGVFFEKGIYVQKNKLQAIYWYGKAAEMGHVDAINNLRVLKQK